MSVKLDRIITKDVVAWCKQWAQRSIENGNHSVTHISGKDLMRLVDVYETALDIIEKLDDCDATAWEDADGADDEGYGGYRYCALCSAVGNDGYQRIHNDDCPKLLARNFLYTP